MNNKIMNDDNTSLTYILYFNTNFINKYKEKEIKITEIYEAEHACWTTTDDMHGTFSDDDHVYTAVNYHKIKSYQNIFGIDYTWNLSLDGKERNKEQCRLYNENISHDKIYIYVNDTLFHTFEFEIIPKNYKANENKIQHKIEAQENINVVWTKPDYSKDNKDSPQIITDKGLHLYNIKNISQFRNTTDKVTVKCDNGSFFFSKIVFNSFKKINFTDKLQKMMEEQGVK